MLERPFAHCYERGGMRRVHLRRHDNILKRLLIHVAGFNLSLVLRQMIGKGTPKGLQNLSMHHLNAIFTLISLLLFDHCVPTVPTGVCNSRTD